MSIALDRILTPYTKRVDSLSHRVRRWLLVAIMGFYACFMGLVIAILPVQAMFIPATPLLILFIIAAWMLPDSDVQVDETLKTALIVFIYCAGLWPVYLAVELPGLPWITLNRAALFALVAIAVYGFAQSSRLRGDVATVFKATPFLMKVFIGWLIIQIITIPLAPQLFGSLNRWVLNQLFWTFPLLIGAWAFSKEGLGLRFKTAILVVALIVSFLVFPETRMGKPIWADHIPFFLKVDDEALMGRILGSQARAADGLYRARSVFNVSLSLAEFMSLVFPFVIHALVTATSWPRRLLLIALYFSCAGAMFLTNNRSGLIGFFLSHIVYSLFWGIKRLRTHGGRRDMVGPSLILMYPMALVAFVIALFSSRTLYVKVIGGGQHQASNDSRGIQYDLMWEKFFRNPFGHGPNQAWELVGFTNGEGTVTLDAYPINLLLDYGIIGFCLFVALFGGAIFYGWRTYQRSDSEELDLTAPASVALVNFLVIKLVLSLEQNHYLAFLLVGLIMAMHYRQTLVDAAKAAVPASVRLQPLRMRR
ncbi:O-antigen ligase family protein [Sandaracinobacteroides saxicola]|uniref:O-antigen ligase family protein n=1 Tax=Sandaracinobacteroides saxicola TaxID=2759707 RepID=A0A7G5IFN6_9SPHN|nr:O-antigen ligase family protein [Sandaracinobacteroides saxicola]QMW22178.1 O-antigen ligase family protein [Sandaracinobacteroides saxicola]